MDTVTRHFHYTRTVRQLTDRHRGLSRLSAVLIGLAVLLVAAALVAGLDTLTALPKDLRQILRLVALTGFAIFLAWRWRQSRKAATDREMVRRMETSLPSTGQLLRTGWELAGKPAATAPEDAGLEAEVVRKSQTLTENHHWSHLLPRRAVFFAAALAAVCLAVIFSLTKQSADFGFALQRVVFPGSAPSWTRPVWNSLPSTFDDRHPPRLVLTISGRPAEPLLHFREAGTNAAWQSRKLTALPDGLTHDAILTGLLADTEVYASAGDGVTETLTLRYRPTPRLLDSFVTVTLPDYTGRPPDKRPGGDVSAVEGSGLRWDFTFNTQPAKAEVQITSATSPPVTIPVHADGGRLTASWPLPLGKYVCLLSVFDDTGASIDSWKYEVGGIPDELPKVEILEPSKDLEATSITELPVRVRARDDFGVAEIGLILEAAGQTFHPLEKVIAARDTTDITEMTRAMLEAVPLSVRDNVRLYAYALDHKPRGGPRAVSPLRAIDIRQFKMRTIFAGKGKKSGFKVPPSAVTQLNKLITSQRVVVSDTHLLREPARTESAAAMIAPGMPVAVKETAVITDAEQVRAAWEDEPGFPGDDIVLLGTATQQMNETVALLNRGTIPKAFASGDRALQTLLQIRKHLLKIIMESEDPGPPDDPPEMSNPQDFIKEALRLAAEEKTVREQITPQPVKKGPQADLQTSRRQQEVALSDAGELYSSLMAYEKKNEGMLSLMRDAELAMKQADARIHTDQPQSSIPSLGEAEKHLLDLADFIKSMDEARLADTLNELAAKADQDARQSRQPSAKPNPSGSPSPSPGGSQPGAEGQTSETAANQSKPDKPGENPDSGPGGKTGGETKPESPAESEAAAKAEAQALAEAARNAALADSILESLSNQAPPDEAGGDDPGNENGQDANSPKASSGLSRSELQALRERAGSETLARDLKNLTSAKNGNSSQPGTSPGTEPGPGNGTNPKPETPNSSNSASQSGTPTPALSARLTDMADQFRAEARRLQASKLARLAEVRAQAQALKDKLEQQQKDEKSKADKALEARLLAQGIPPGTRVRINGKTIILGQSSDPTANDPAQQPDGNNPGANGQQPGQNGNTGANNQAANGKGKGKGEGESEAEGTDTGGGNRSVLGGPATKRFVAEARRLNDEPVTTWTKQLETEVPDVAIPALTGIIQRLDTLVAELPADGGEKSMAGRIPESSRREVEDYFKNLSDDLDDE